MATNLKEHFLVGNSKDTGFSSRILISIRATSLMVSTMERENTHGAQEIYTKVTMRKDKKVDMEFIKR